MTFKTKARIKQGRPNKFEQRFRQKQGNRFLGGNTNTSKKGRFNKKFKVKKVLTSTILGGAALLGAKTANATEIGITNLRLPDGYRQSKHDATFGAGILLAIAGLCFGLAAVHRHNRLERAKQELRKAEADLQNTITEGWNAIGELRGMHAGLSRKSRSLEEQGVLHTDTLKKL